MVCFRAAVLKAKNGRGRLLPLPAPVLFPLCTSQLGTWHRFHWFIKVQLYAKKRLIVNQSKLHRSNGFFRQQFACLHAIYFVAEHVHILPDMCGNEYKFTLPLSLGSACSYDAYSSAWQSSMHPESLSSSHPYLPPPAHHRHTGP